MKTLSTPGLILSGIYVIASVYLIATQGLFGETFIALILGLPWSLAFSFFEFGGATGGLLAVMLIVPMIVNAAILYWIGSLFRRR